VPVRTKQTPVDRLFVALSNPTRRDILDLLLAGPQTTARSPSGLTWHGRASRSTCAHCSSCGLITERSVGRNVVYAAAPEPLLAVRDWLTPHERFWRERLRAMGRVLDELAEADAAEDGA